MFRHSLVLLVVGLPSVVLFNLGGKLNSHKNGRQMWMSFDKVRAPLDYSPTSKTGCSVRIYYDEYYRTDETHEQRLEHIKNMMEFVNMTYYQQLMQIYIKDVSGPVAFEDIPATGVDWNGNILSEMTKNSDYNDVCVVMWLTGRMFTEGVVGVAYLGGACSQCGASSVGFSSVGTMLSDSHTMYERLYIESTVVSHEIGHLMGADHWSNEGTSVMNPTISGFLDPYNLIKFSSGALQEIHNYMQVCDDPTCLTPIPTSSDNDYDAPFTLPPIENDNPFVEVQTTYRLHLIVVLGTAILLPGFSALMLLVDVTWYNSKKNKAYSGAKSEFKWLLEQ